MQHLAGHVRRIIRGQEHITRRDLSRIPRPLNGTSVPKVFTFSGGKLAGISGVHTGPGATAFTRMPFSTSASASDSVERDDRALGGRIVQKVRAAFVRGDRSCIDDGAALMCLSDAFVR